MENKNQNIFLSFLFLFLILFLIVGGFFYTKSIMNNNDENVKKIEKKETKDYRIDKTKDYIYFENEKVISAEPEISFMDVIINIQGSEIITSSLKTEMDNIRNSIVYLSDSNKDATKTPIYEDSNIFSAKERVYNTYKSSNYLSLIISDLDYNCYDDLKISGIKGFVLDVKKGRSISTDDLLIKYSLTIDDIKTRISDHLDKTQSIVEEKEVIKKEDTLNSLQSNYALYLKESDLYISYIVKTNFVDYNDSIKVN